MPEFLSKSSLPSFLRRGVLNGAGEAGPRRIVVIAATVASMFAIAVAASMIHHQPPPQSQAARMPTVNPLPGGLQSNPQQDALALRSAQEAADQAIQSGRSYTPPMAASQPMEPVPVVDDTPPISPAPPPMQPHIALAPRPIPIPPFYRRATPIQQVSAVEQDPQAQQAFRNAVTELFQTWQGQTPRTDVVIPSTKQDEPASDFPQSSRSFAGSGGDASGAVAPASAVSDPITSESGRTLIPAGRGIYAHTVLSVNSDTGGPIVLQADSGPIAGDRMIGVFAKNGYDRLVVRVTSIEYQGTTIDANAIVVAPDTMETAVASSVDEHYLQRFMLPAAAAFVQGLGQAIATTSNTQAVLSPLGGASYSTHLDLNQQMGVAAGTAAQQIGSALTQEAPKGPTVNLAANINVGVMFLGDLKASDGP